MKKNLKFFVFIITGFIILNVSNSCYAGSVDTSNVIFTAHVLENGDMEVTETWETYLSQTSTLFKEFEANNDRYSQVTNAEVFEVIDGKKVKLQEINELMFHLPENKYYGMINDNNNFEIAWGTGYGHLSGYKKYIIKYKIIDAVTTYNDYSELYWMFLGDGSFSAKRIDGDIYLPQNDNPLEDIRAWGHSQNIKSDIDFVSNSHIKFFMDYHKEGQMVEIRTIFPNNMVNNVKRVKNEEILPKALKEEKVLANVANFRKMLTIENIFKFIAFFFKVIFPNLIVLIIIKKNLKSAWRKIKDTIESIQDTGKIDKVSKIQYFREIPRENASPSQACFLYREKRLKNFSNIDIENIFSATILDLLLKDLISIEFKNGIFTKNNFEIEITRTSKILKLPKEEQDIYYYLEKIANYNGKKKISSKDIKRYIKNNPVTTSSMLNNMKNHTINNLDDEGNINSDAYKDYEKSMDFSYVKNAFNTIIRLLLAYGILFYIPLKVMYPDKKIFLLKLISKLQFSKILLYLMFGIILINIVSISLQLIFTRFMTQKGRIEAEKWRGLKRFMENYSLLDERDVHEVVIWEKYLVYATAFNISKKVLKKIKRMYPDFEDLLDKQKLVLNNYDCIGMCTRNISSSLNRSVYRYNNPSLISTIFTSSGSSSSSHSSSYRSASSSGRGGGFSSGGGGGGGRRKLWRKIIYYKLNLNIELYFCYAII